MESSGTWGADQCVSECRRCDALVSSRSRIVNGVGPTDADLVIVGEAPGEREDATGEPFVGRSGELLTEELAAAGLPRSAVRITNCVRCRPPDNRDPWQEELTNCREWLERELQAVSPAAVLAVGKVPASHLLERDVAVTAEAGAVEELPLGDQTVSVVICVHPAAVLYDRSNEARLRAAIKVAAEHVGATPPADPQTALDSFETD